MVAKQKQVKEGQQMYSPISLLISATEENIYGQTEIFNWTMLLWFKKV